MLNSLNNPIQCDRSNDMFRIHTYKMLVEVRSHVFEFEVGSFLGLPTTLLTISDAMKFLFNG